MIDVETGNYRLTVSYQRAVGVLTGLGLLFYLRKMRVSALVVMAGGAALVVALAVLA